MDLYILKHLEEPMTDRDLHKAYNRVKDRQKATYDTIRRRRNALVNSGHVVKSKDYEVSDKMRVRALWVSRTK